MRVKTFSLTIAVDTLHQDHLITVLIRALMFQYL